MNKRLRMISSLLSGVLISSMISSTTVLAKPINKVNIARENSINDKKGTSIEELTTILENYIIFKDNKVQLSTLDYNKIGISKSDLLDIEKIINDINKCIENNILTINPTTLEFSFKNNIKLNKNIISPLDIPDDSKFELVLDLNDTETHDLISDLQSNSTLTGFIAAIKYLNVSLGFAIYFYGKSEIIRRVDMEGGHRGVKIYEIVGTPYFHVVPR